MCEGSTLSVPEGDARETFCGETPAGIMENEAKEKQTQSSFVATSPASLKSYDVTSKANLDKDTECRIQETELNAEQSQFTSIRQDEESRINPASLSATP